MHSPGATARIGKYTPNVQNSSGNYKRFIKREKEGAERDFAYF